MAMRIMRRAHANVTRAHVADEHGGAAAAFQDKRSVEAHLVGVAMPGRLAQAVSLAVCQPRLSYNRATRRGRLGVLLQDASLGISSLDLKAAVSIRRPFLYAARGSRPLPPQRWVTSRLRRPWRRGRGDRMEGGLVDGDADHGSKLTDVCKSGESADGTPLSEPRDRRLTRDRGTCPNTFSAHLSPLGWEHINLTGSRPDVRDVPDYAIRMRVSCS
jgi:hypothetical protein